MGRTVTLTSENALGLGLGSFESFDRVSTEFIIIIITISRYDYCSDLTSYPATGGI